jgi:hypothetical protein
VVPLGQRPLRLMLLFPSDTPHRVPAPRFGKKVNPEIRLRSLQPTRVAKSKEGPKQNFVSIKTAIKRR